MRRNWVIEGHKGLNAFVKYLSHIGSYIWLKNIEGHLDEVTFDRKSYEVL